ncbi:MAG: hypothetical protein LRZ88_06200 [Candidatus Cloacimonetes bacterium]|nr:hypothetical protein [Candidatus Cloacimonadota bacterium]
MKNSTILILLSLVIILVAGCDRKTGEALTMPQLPTDYVLNLYGANEGIHPDTSVLDNPDNPFAHASINMENIWDLSDECPSPKAKFYLWASLLANIPVGEHQYFTARALHELYTIGGSTTRVNKPRKPTVQLWITSSTMPPGGKQTG